MIRPTICLYQDLISRILDNIAALYCQLKLSFAPPTDTQAFFDAIQTRHSHVEKNMDQISIIRGGLSVLHTELTDRDESTPIMQILIDFSN